MTAQEHETQVGAEVGGPVNEVVLVGRVSGEPQERTMPSGDTLVSFLVVVARPPGSVGRTTVDALDCVTWTARVKRSALGWRPDDVVEVHGALRRRFFSTGAGRVSRTEVDVSRAKLLRRARTG
ncbi:single-stranded DNA-binding protein [Nocardioides litoris]|uniref:single-stranded DNA-binding protein n=1 Tax=Nocardioides litoris TaxID=1926648 RepID=UPI0011217A4D|nr:single-stranded DNA-binding protein [Nocardioides litoris]